MLTRPAALALRALPLAVLVLAGVSSSTVGVRLDARQGFPPRLDAYFTKTLKLTPAERQTLSSGASITRQLDADPGKEVALFGAIWINAPMSRYVAAIDDIENFEKGGGFIVTKKVSEPARIEDFAALQIPDEDVADLEQCQVGDCELKLPEEGIKELRQKVDWSKADVKAQVERLVRVAAVNYVNAYREGGNRRLAVYRDTENPTFVAKEFQDLIARMPEFAAGLPEMRAYLLDYPKPSAPPMKSFIYWQEAQFGLKPTIRVNHLVIQEGAEATVVANKQLYSSHYFWTALELRVLMRDPSRGEGFWFVTVTRSRSDGLSGFVGRMIRGKVREASQKGVESMLKAAKSYLERR